MNPKLVFWVPAALRTAIILVACAVVGWMAGWMTGIIVALLAMMVMVFVQLNYLYQLSNWMDDPQSAKLPDGWGAWTNIFSRLYRMRRDDEKNQAELTEWLARFRQAMHLLPDGVVIMDDVLFLEWCNPAAERHLGLTHERDKGMRVTNLVRSPDFMDYIILGRYEQPLTISFRERKLIVHIIPFENRRQILVTHDATESERIEHMRRDFIGALNQEARHVGVDAHGIAVVDRFTIALRGGAVEAEFAWEHLLAEVAFADEIRHDVNHLAVHHLIHFAHVRLLFPEAAHHFTKQTPLADRVGVQVRRRTGVRVRRGTMTDDDEGGVFVGVQKGEGGNDEAMPSS